MSTTEHDRFAEWDAAYVLGALTPADRRAYEEHLDGCETCRRAVAELAPMPGLLARTRPEPVVEPLPDDLVERMLRREEKRLARRRRRARLWALAAVLALIVAIGVPTAMRLNAPRPETTAVSLSPVGATAMTADVTLEPVAWGTRLSIECGYPGEGTWSGPAGPWTYALLVTDAEGRASQVSTWTAVPGRTITLEAATALRVDDIASVSVVGASGVALLQADVAG